MQELILDILKRYLPGPFRPTGGGNVQTKCPFHKQGEERKPSFSINLENGLFLCFTCHNAGDIRHLLSLLGLPKNMVDVETGSIGEILQQNKAHSQLERDNLFKRIEKPFACDSPLAESILGVYEFCPTQLLEKGFDINLLRLMEVGFDKRHNRITYPIRDLYGSLAGISGGATSPNQYPKYKVYEGRKKDKNGNWIDGDFGPWFDESYPFYHLENHNYLWNFHRVFPILSQMSGSDDRLFIVEGFKACLWMIQNGFPNTIALMGSSISDRQLALISQLGSEVTLCLDNDEAGIKGAIKIGYKLWEHKFKVKVLEYPKEDCNTQPDNYEPEILKTIVALSKPYLEYKKTRIGENNVGKRI